jgi:hypothetical protein
VAFAQFGGSGQFGSGGKSPSGKPHRAKGALPAAEPAASPAEGQATDQRVFPGGLPPIESMLKSALEHHPQVLASRSKLRAAEAELRQSELSALKDVMEARARWEVARGHVDTVASRETLGDLAAIEWELAFLLGTRGDLTTEPAAGGAAPRATPFPVPAVRAAPAIVTDVIPRGPQAKTIKERLDQEISLKLEETPLTDVATFLSEASGLRFILDKQALENEGLPNDTPITLRLGEVELGSALQALEDLHKPLYFVIRDYGVLITTESNVSYRTVAVRDFWKLTDEELREKLRQQYQEEHGVGGGMGGGFF